MEYGNTPRNNGLFLFLPLVLTMVMGSPLRAMAEEEKISDAKPEVKEEKKEEKREEKKADKAGTFAASVINYGELTHTISLANLRAGNHDPSGVNHYFFTAEIFALLVNKEEKKLEFIARKKVARPLGTFAEIEIKALSPWEKDEKETAKNSLIVEGDLMRAITSEAMRKFAGREAEIAIKIDVHMMEKAKKFYFLGQDTLIGTVSYYPIPEIVPRQASKENLILNITDDLGTNADIMVKYKANEKPTQKK